MNPRQRRSEVISVVEGPSKSDMFRQMYDEGYSIAEIANMTNNYYSFVHRVIKRYKKQKADHTPPSAPTLNKDVVFELAQEYDVDSILKQLGLPEKKRGEVYKIWLEARGI